MIAQCTLEEAVETVRAADRGKWDAIIPCRQLAMKDGLLRLGADAPMSRPDVLDPNEWAIGQLCNQIGVPASYYQRCPDHLKDEQFNYWLKRYVNEAKNEPSWLLRAQDTTLRAVLSSRYGRLDNEPLIACLERHVDSSMVVQSVCVTDISFHIRLLKPASRRMVRVGDEICAGIHIANSEVGMRAVTVDALVYRLVCTNGLIRTVKGSSLYKRRHIGNFSEDLAAALPEAIGQSFEEARTAMERFAESTTMTVSDPEKEISAFAKSNGFTEEFAKNALFSLAHEDAANQSTRYGIINALTAVARTMEPDARYRVEQLAGGLL